MTLSQLIKSAASIPLALLGIVAFSDAVFGSYRERVPDAGPGFAVALIVVAAALLYGVLRLNLAFLPAGLQRFCDISFKRGDRGEVTLHVDEQHPDYVPDDDEPESDQIITARCKHCGGTDIQIKRTPL